MELHLYTPELLEHHLLPELKEIAQGLGIIPAGNKTRRDTWVNALVGQPFPIFQTVEPIALGDNLPIETPPGVEDIQAQEPIKNSPGVDTLSINICVIDNASMPGEPIENSPGVDRIQHQEPIEFPDLEAALAEIARLREQNDKLLELARSQSATIRTAKDISPVEKPSFKRVFALAQEALLDISRTGDGGWLLSMGPLKRIFKRLRHIWDLLVGGDWYLSDLFDPPPPPTLPKPLFPPVHSRYSAVPFCDDELIDLWSLGFAGVGDGGRAPPGGGDAML